MWILRVVADGKVFGQYGHIRSVVLSSSRRIFDMCDIILCLSLYICPHFKHLNLPSHIWLPFSSFRRSSCSYIILMNPKSISPVMDLSLGGAREVVYFSFFLSRCACC